MQKKLEELTRDELKAKATELGIEFAPNVSDANLIKKIEEHEAGENKGDGGDGGADQKSSTTKTEKTVIYYVVKMPSYISDKEILGAGVYRTSKVIARFEGQSTQFIEKHIGDIPDIFVYDLARSKGLTVHTEDMKLVPVAELVEKLVTVLD